MNKDILDYVSEKTKELISAPSCSGEAKAAAQAWLNAVGTEKAAGAKYCDCPACSAGAAILEKKDSILK